MQNMIAAQPLVHKVVLHMLKKNRKGRACERAWHAAAAAGAATWRAKNLDENGLFSSASEEKRRVSSTFLVLERRAGDSGRWALAERRRLCLRS